LALEPTALPPPPPQTQPEGKLDVILLEDVKMERGPIQFVLPANKAEMIDAIAQLLNPEAGDRNHLAGERVTFNEFFSEK